MPDSVAPATEEGDDERGGRAQRRVVEISREGVKKHLEDGGVDGERENSVSEVGVGVR